MGSCLSKLLPCLESGSVSVTDLPDPCLIALFKQLPPADRMTASTVCRRWADLVPFATTRPLAILVGDGRMNYFESVNYFEKEINCSSLGSIKVVSLLKKEDGSPMFPLERFNKWNALQYRGEDELDEATVEAIAGTFLNLDTLQIGLRRATSFQLNIISRLLERWACQLTTLKVLEDSTSLNDHSVNHFFAAINGLTTVKHLRLDLRSLPYHDMPVISQLERLHVYWNACPPHQFAALLRQHATASTSLRSIEYLCGNPISAIEHFTSLSDHLLTRFTHFGLPGSRHINSKLISTHFRHLISLYTSPTFSTLHRLFGHLSQLAQLLHLHLEIKLPFKPDDQPHLLLPQLKSVKALKLDLIIYSHLDLKQLKISWTMPNIEAIEFDFKFFQCTDCTIEWFSDMRANLATFKHCLRQMFTPLKANCTKLRTILHDREAILGKADELLAQ